MPPQSAENKFKILIAVLSQSATNEKDFLPTPNYDKLAEDLGLPTYASAQGVWKRLKDEIKRGDFGDLKIRNSTTGSISPGKKPAAVKESKVQSRSPGKKRAVEEWNERENEPKSSPTKRSKVHSIKRDQSTETDKEGRAKVSKESDGELMKPGSDCTGCYSSDDA
ncbi:hypothetical protein MFRU_003g04210 [Monilinia fructicola]|uniref:Uncharacterized protein n=1 Tax=Monilinia fructicola TaxID=38448 RepID=A0A5M9JUR3_MONFR|nr:hypothetical protein EYC84_002973 [Monilinia fructicola]KAG4034458.1 hypothetical protein MFRU_003g04210 [Monilinia fructicola]